MKLPRARTENIVVQTIKGEVLIYDLETGKAFCLNETAAIVYQACDGAQTVDEVKAANHFDEDVIYLALDQLEKDDLLARDAGYVSPLAGISRRQVIRRIGLSSMVVLPVIASLISPTAAGAASSLRTLGQSCSRATNNNPRQGNCLPGLVCFGTVGSCQIPGAGCICDSPGACLTQVACPSTNNCNSINQCAP